jgi:hypothetical protein
MEWIGEELSETLSLMLLRDDRGNTTGLVILGESIDGDRRNIKLGMGDLLALRSYLNDLVR